MYTAERPRLRPVILFLVIVGWLLVGCAGQVTNTSWPGLATDGTNVYVAYGPRVLAYNVAERQLDWSFPTETARAQFFAAPSLHDNRVVFGDYGAAGGFFSPGIVVSVYALENRGEGEPVLLWTEGGVARDRIIAPALQVDDRIFIGTADNYLLALDAQTGDVQWEFETGHSIWAQPAYKDGTLFIASLDKTVYALTADTGQELWRATLGGAIAGQPITDTDLVYVASFDRKLHALDISTGQERWTAEASDWIWGSPALADGVVYFADARGNVYAVSAETGEQLWSQSLQEAVQTSPVVADDKVYIASQGQVTEAANEEARQGSLFALSTADGQQLWKESTPAPLYTTPVVVEDAVVVVLQSDAALLIGFDRESGARLWDFLLPSNS